MSADEMNEPLPFGPELQGLSVDAIESAYAGRAMPEAVRMYLGIQREDFLGVGHGWFDNGKSRYDWRWLCERCGIDAAATAIARDQFSGTDVAFRGLDRDRDGRIAPSDLDWSDENPWVQYAYMVNRLFRKADSSGDGQLTRAEWNTFFDRAAENRDFVTAAELRNEWLAGMGGGFLPGDAPTKEMLLKGLFSSELGSLQEGPVVGDLTPDFTLQTQDGAQTIQLSKQIGPKPVVLVFGNFTCGPFRSMYPEVDEIAKRYRNQATFLAVYVREAHPTNGWAMQSNEKVGVKIAQPTSLAERRAVAAQCSLRLKPSIPLLVDEIHDPVGNAYSGMPARLYVLDSAGKVAYKSGRGPFGFKAGEMEQALVMTLLDRQP
jgi:thiol-disulfide isomerase/thioredoxin